MANINNSAERQAIFRKLMQWAFSGLASPVVQSEEHFNEWLAKMKQLSLYEELFPEAKSGIITPTLPLFDANGKKIA